MNSKIALLAVLLSACSTPKVEISKPFDQKQAQLLLSEGNNTIKGSALIRQNSGNVVTCAGREVSLIPVTEHASERMTAIYGSTDHGYNQFGFGWRVEFSNSDPAYLKLQRKTICDAQGFFKFNNIADGSFFLATVITWQIDAYNTQGGAIMQRVTLKNGSTEEIVLTPH